VVAITEENRHQLYLALEEVIGHEQATTLMEHLPPVGWADVATKRDVDALAAHMDLRFEALEHKFEATLHRELSSLKSGFLLTVVLSNTTLAGLVLAAVKLF
jgi:hypothetical protein